MRHPLTHSCPTSSTLSLSFSPPPSPHLPPASSDVLAALHSLYLGWGSPSTLTNTWTTGSTSPCSGPWTGIYCNTAGDTITQLSLPQSTVYSASSFISKEISQLTSLQEILIGGTKTLGGSLPPQLSLLTALTTLIIGTNNIVGPIPQQVSVLTNLQGLFLDSNALTGPLPAQLSTLNNLQHLVVYGNRMTGTLPPALSSLAARINGNLAVYGNAAMCGSTAGFSSVDTSGTRLNQACLGRSMSCVRIRRECRVPRGN